MQGKNIWGLHKAYNGMFREGTKAGERDGSRWFGDELAWENGGKGDARGWLHVKWLLVGMSV